VTAALTRRFGDLDIAEEAAAEAFATAVERWPADGLPPSPGAWLTTIANRKAVDRIRRENKRDDKHREARIPYRVPSAEDLPARVTGVLAVLYLVFNEGYLATGPDADPVRHDLTTEAIRLTRLIRALLPQDGEVAGLLALMLLTEARRTARISANGELVSLDEQDGGAWDAELIAEGHWLMRERLAAAAAGVAPGRYQILAAINAVHTSARDVRDTDWSQVLALYDQLVRLDPSPIIALNRAIAVAERDGPEMALAIVDVGRLSRLPRHPRRPAAPAGPKSAVTRGPRPGHRAGRQHRRDRLPHPPPRPTAVVPALEVRT
jgi:predicted RNA polymerase sigma factor